MPVLFRENVLQQLEIEKEQLAYLLQEKEIVIEQVKVSLEESEKQIADTLVAITNSSVDYALKEALKGNISLLEQNLMLESDVKLKSEKYACLATMLHCVIIDSTATIEKKNQSLIKFLDGFNKPQTKAVMGAKRLLGIAGLVLMLGLMVATLYLIPFAAAFTWMGLGGTGLSIATGAAKFVSNIGGALIGIFAIKKLIQVLMTPLAKIINSFRKEFKLAKSVERLTRDNFFKSEPTNSIKDSIGENKELQGDSLCIKHTAII